MTPSLRRSSAAAPLALLALAAGALPSAAAAHDFWLQPARWQVSTGEPLAISLQVGHGMDRQRSQISAARVTRFEAIGPDGRRVDLRDRLRIGDATQDASVTFASPGEYLLLFETDNRAESHLPADRFNAYLRDEGLTPAIELRERTARGDTDGAETYSRHARTVVRVGNAAPDRPVRTHRPSELLLDIVPDDVSAIAARRPFHVTIYHKGSPLPGALVKLNDLDDDAAPVSTVRSDASGRAIFTVPHIGSWQLNVVWTEPAPPNGATDFDTRFASLSLGIEE